MEHMFSSMFGHKTGSTDAVANVGNCKKLKLKYLSFDMEGRCQEKKDTTLAKNYKKCVRTKMVPSVKQQFITSHTRD